MSDLRLPDPGECFREWVGTVTPVTDIVGGRISTRLSSSAPSIRYALVGGQHAPELGDPLLQVECWGPSGVDGGESSAIVHELIAALSSFRGPYAGGWVVGAAVDGYPYESPDPTSSRPRHITLVRLVTAPATT